MSTNTVSLPLAERLPVIPRLELAAVARPSVRRISSQRLLEGERELVIQHMDSEYHLRLTRNGKLILTK